MTQRFFCPINNHFEGSGTCHSLSGSTRLYDSTYKLDSLGRIVEKTETIGGNSTTYAYAYDEAGNLKEVKKDGSVVASYAYDENGNRLSRTTPSGTTEGSYDVQDRLTSYGGNEYAYAPDGQLKTKTDTSTGNVTSYDYDALGNLLSVTLPDGKQVEYVVDAAERRVGKKVDGQLVQGFLYQGQFAPVAELDGAGNVVSRFVYATRMNVPDYMEKGGKTYRIITDQVGSVRLVVDAVTGEVAKRIDYDEFGNVLEDSNPGFQPFGFAGGLYDPDTKLTRFGARDYDAEIGRWTTKDPILFGGGDTNLYRYALGDPINLVDLTGQAPSWFDSREARILDGIGKLIKSLKGKPIQKPPPPPPPAAVRPATPNSAPPPAPPGGSKPPFRWPRPGNWWRLPPSGPTGVIIFVIPDFCRLGLLDCRKPNDPCPVT